MKKQIKSILLVALSLVMAAACSNAAKEAEGVANDFLSSYFATDYETAAACCTPELSEALMTAVQEYYSLEENIKNDVKDISSQVVTTITSVESISKDSVLVKYDIDMPEPDPTIQSTLIITNVEGNWRIAEF